MPARPIISPAVGKSGPLIMSINSKVVISGFSDKASTPSMDSVKLCGGIFVAIPTAIPEAPFTSRLGKCAGNTTGSRSVSS